jgi:peptidyl-dipeptidase A
MGIDVLPILNRSDMYERIGKSQHAFCVHIDRLGDVRTLNNVKPTIQWLETVLHELGHAIYEIGFDPALPWLLREPPHMIPTEAMALLAGRQTYLEPVLNHLNGGNDVLVKSKESVKRRQQIFSRWVLVMTAFERALYQHPEQDLNQLWWSLVNRYQKIQIPQGRSQAQDWAAKHHIGLAPVYYYSYLLGELFASSIEEALLNATGASTIANEKAGQFLQEKLFRPGNRMNWMDLVLHVTGKPLSPDAWVKQFC